MKTNIIEPGVVPSVADREGWWHFTNVARKAGREDILVFYDIELRMLDDIPKEVYAQAQAIYQAWMLGAWPTPRYEVMGPCEDDANFQECVSAHQTLEAARVVADDHGPTASIWDHFAECEVVRG